MKQSAILGISGIDRNFAVSLVADGAVAFAIEEDKLRRFRGLGMRHLETLGSRALDLALSGVAGGMRGIERVAYVPSAEAEPEQTAEETVFVSNFLERHYGFLPQVVAVDHLAARLAFENAVNGGPSRVLYAGAARAVYTSPGAHADDFDRRFPVVSFVYRCAEFFRFDRSRVHHLENMALQGEPKFAGALRKVLDLDVDFGSEDTGAILREITGSDRVRFGDDFKPVHFDLAASLYSLLRSEICALVRSIPRERMTGALALSGEVFQNWTLNDALAQEFPAARFAVSFAPGDAGCAIGGPLALAGVPAGGPLGPFLGVRYGAAAVKDVLDNCKARYEFLPFNGVLDAVCEALAKGAMVGWFYGPCEFGYRALGARSVFANPKDPYACDNLSSFLKRRPAYFTYGVAMKDADSPGVDSPHLSRSTQAPEYFGDARVRIQTVARAANPALHQLLEAFQARSGVRALLNTSLNYFEEPIACTPRDALKTFHASGLDMLVMENFVLRKS